MHSSGTGETTMQRMVISLSTNIHSVGKPPIAPDLDTPVTLDPDLSIYLILLTAVFLAALDCFEGADHSGAYLGAVPQVPQGRCLKSSLGP